MMPAHAANPTVRLPYKPRQRAHVASVDHRLADRWNCAIGTAKARRERAVTDSLTVIEECLAGGDTDRLRHYLNLIDAALAGQPLQRTDPIHAADRADAAEDVLECNYRERPCRETARAWFDGLALEGRTNEPAMAAIREQWDL
jgi:hypothetical protein